MAFLNLDLDYFDHPKTKRLVGLLGRGSDVLPIRLWCYCGKYHAENGDMTGYSPTDLESLIGWWGQPGKAVEAMVQLRFIDSVRSGFVIHDWAEINGHIAAMRLRGKAGAKARWSKVREDAQAMLKHSLSNAVSNALTLNSLREEEDKEKNKKRIKTVLSHVDGNNLIPLSDPPNIEVTRKSIKPKAKLTRTEIPLDWALPVGMVEWCREKNLPGPEYQLPIFIDYWRGKGETHADWAATFRNWMRSPYRKDEVKNEQNGNSRGNTGGYQTSQQRISNRLVEVSRKRSKSLDGYGDPDYSAVRIGQEGDSSR